MKPVLTITDTQKAELLQQAAVPQSGYNGSQDDFLAIKGSAAGFAGEVNESNTYKFTVSNVSADTDREVTLNSSVITWDDINTDIAITGISSDYGSFISYLVSNPTRVKISKTVLLTCQLVFN